MFQIIITIIGLILGIVAFTALSQAIPSLTHNKFIAIFVFILFFGAGIGHHTAYEEIRANRYPNRRMGI